MAFKKLLFAIFIWCEVKCIQGKYVSLDSEKSHVERIIGGMTFEEGKWPFLVSLQGKIPSATLFGIPLAYRTYSCGASLINDKWILTAAHCFPIEKYGDDATDPKYWHARLGDIHFSPNVLEKIKGVIGNVLSIDDWKDWNTHADKIIIHPHYDPSKTWHNDLALIRLVEDVPSGEEILPHIQSVDLPIQGDFSFPADGQRCFMKGWGCSANGGRVSSVAKEVILPKVSDSDCKSYWNVPATERLCAGYNLADMGICSGDSGGPLSCQTSDGRWVQVGIASFTSANNPGNVPGVFTRVSQYSTWIRDITRT